MGKHKNFVTDKFKFFTVRKRILLLLLSIASASCAFISARQVETLRDWKFHSGDVDMAMSETFDDREWKSVKVPHDWAISGAFDMEIDKQIVKVIEDGDSVAKMRTGRTGALPAFGIGWYRTVVRSHGLNASAQVRLEFDGAMSNSVVYVNGHECGRWPYGYSSFAFNVTPYWNNTGNNVIAVRLDNKPESSRWYSGAGLYRNVRVVYYDAVSVAHWGMKVVTPKITEKKGDVTVSTTVENNTGKPVKVIVETSIYTKKGALLATGRKNVQIKDTTASVDIDLTVDSPHLWDIVSPTIYVAESKIFVDGKVRDRHTVDFGFRSIRYDKDHGFYLNGNPVKMQGVCLHHDLGPLGAAVNFRALQRQLEMMKEMGCNAIRTSHNPPTPELLQLCDSLGLLVQVEAFDEWRLGKNANGYHLYFEEWAERDLRNMIRRDRNHPCVVMWSIGNEVREQQAADGYKTAAFLANICREEDATRPVTAGFNNHVDAIKNGLADCVDLVGFNYKPHDYEHKHEEYPDFILYGSETASTVSSRGEYKFPAVERKGPWYDDYHVSSYDLEFPNWASTPDTEFEQQDKCPFVFGEFVWTGFDYLGEPTPYNEGTPARSSYFGIVDLGGLKKDRFYLYQSRWSNRPVLHVLPHWNWEGMEGKTIPVHCYTNYPKAELFVNGKSYGVRELSEQSKYSRHRMIWDAVEYQPGELQVVAYNEVGKAVDTAKVVTAGKPYAIRLTPDRNRIKAGGDDLSFITVEIVDDKGNVCPTSDNMVYFEVKGATRYKSSCNGDPTDQVSFVAPYKKAFNGKLILIVESGEMPGQSQVLVYGGKLKQASCVLDVY